MRDGNWTRFSLAVMLIALLAAAITAIASPSAIAFQSSPPSDGTGMASPVANIVASPLASPSAQAAANQVFVTGPWRFEVTLAQQGPAFSDFNLPEATGMNWIVTVVDALNWGGKDATLDPKQFGARAAGAADSVGLAPSSSKRMAQQLKLEPINPDAGVKIKKNRSARLVLAFQVDATGRDYSLTFGSASLPLARSISQNRGFDAMPAPSAPPAFAKDAFTSTVSGDSVVLQSRGVTLADVDAPIGKDCFSAEATARITKLLKGKTIETEPAGDGSYYLWIDQSDGTRDLLNAALIGDGYAAAAQPLTGPYASWLEAAAASAKSASAGLWGACTNQHGQLRPVQPVTTPLQSISDGKARSYVAWIAYPPKIVATPDGGAWIFYSAQPTSGADATSERLFASHYNPATGAWAAAIEMPGGQFQMGVSAVVDSAGRVHIVYSDQAKPNSYAQLMYTHEDGAGGWTKPVAVSTDPNSGHQLYASLAIDKNDVLHVAWQDQRVFSDKARKASASNADILASDYKPGDANWSKPFLVNTHFFDSASLLPHLVVDGDRLVLAWSVYSQQYGLNTATNIDWAWRPLDKPLGWSIGQPLVAGRGDAFGGRLVDLAADPTGGVVMVFDRQATDTFLFLRRLKPGATEWGGDILIAFGARGNYPTVTVAANGTVYITYEAVIDNNVRVAAVAVPYRSVVPGPETILTKSEPASQGRAGLATDPTSKPWIVYIAESADGKTNQVEALRNADVPAVAPAAKPS